ncbi:ABC transporter permease [Paenibacillus roseipurpureus]|uniref:ABC transporter permease n=1 Tax=Paenibacillus roseopurpureus TaxID=2918901 RepID=A0AA96RLH7_9BACL|nr:ABC transporter permease [Paenibacillus sp. MBLB1832]WNR45396.1 ABC transporter permease [Paenibacillus sp. MBLB1832]
MSRLSQWMTLYRKEMLEMSRNAKWIWVPLVFIIVGVMQPVTTYYTPQIIKSMGGLPEGAIIEIPIPSPQDVIVKTLSQFGTIGILILVLVSMAIVSGERQSGVAGMIMIKPVPHVSYITAKWAGIQTLALVSFGCGYTAAAYYTVELFGKIEAVRLIQGFTVYSLWLAFIVTVTVVLGTWLTGSGAIAFAAIATAIVLSVAGSLFKPYMAWSPSMLVNHASALVSKEQSSDQLLLCVISSLILIALLLAGGVRLFKNRSDLTG